MAHIVSVCRLSDAFYSAYPSSQYPEIEHKHDRPYACLLLHIDDSFVVCIPFRSHISHNNAYMFSSSVRSRRTSSGLDYSKCVLINNLDYIDDAAAIVDNDEYNEMMYRINIIVRDIVSYIETYKNHVTGTNVLHPREYARKYRYSTLPYFHDILFPTI